MKPFSGIFLSIILLGGTGLLRGQTAAGGGQAATATQQLPAPTPYAVVSQDGNSQVWERTEYELAPDGTAIPTKHDYTELASGLNYQDPATGQWTPSKEEIDLQPGSDGASATQGQHQTYFPGDIFQGVIQEVTPDGLQLQSRPVGLFFADDTNSVLIAILTNSVGELVSSNQIVYLNAFEGADASIRYTYRKSGFEQDVIVQGQLPDPGTLGLDPAKTRLGVLTVFFDTNTPVVTPGAVDTADGLNDSTLTFGSMTMGPGRAFGIGDTEPSTPPVGATPAAFLNWMTNIMQQAGETPTFKHWFRLDGRNYLMEEVPYQRVSAQLSQLPAATARQNVISTNLYAANSFLDAIPARLLSPAVQVSKSKMTRLARREQPHGLVLDYVTVSSGTAYTFQGDTTYFVSGACYFSNITLEGGTVIKYINHNSATAYIEVSGTVTCNTSSYRPAVFTAYDDNTVGQTLPYSTGNPYGYYAYPAIYAPGGFSLSNVRISYADPAVRADNTGSSSTLSDSQVVNCQLMAELGNGSAQSITLTCNNCLFEGLSGYGLFAWDNGYYEGGDRYYLNNCTIEGASYLVAGTLAPYYVNATNCVFANGSLYMSGSYTRQGGYNGFYNTSYTFGSSPITTTSNPFQPSGGGNFYLASGSTFQGKGTTAGVSPSLLADLKTKTTYPPNVSYIGQTIIADNFTTQVPRDSESPGPDLGYHYDPLDYVFQNCTVSSTMTFPPGTAVGWQGQGLAFSAGYGINFDGTAALPCYFVRCTTVQESAPSGDGIGIEGAGQWASVNATFTRFSALGDLATFFDAQIFDATLNNCEVWSGQVGGVASGGLDRNFYFYNCLFDRTAVNETSPSGGYLIDLEDCTLHGGSLTVVNNYNNDISDYAHYSAFDNTSIAVDASGMSFSHNAFLNNANSYLPDSSPQNDQNSDVFVSSFNWQPGPLGNYYLPDDPPAQDGTKCIDAGDQQADQINVDVNGATDAMEPLSYFTTQTNEQLDSLNVDIGYHYVATDVLNGPGAPQLTTTCLSDGIALTWTYTVKPEFPITGFEIYRSTSQNGTYTLITPTPLSPDSRFYVDKTVSQNQNYCYLVTFDYYDPFTDTTYPTSPAAPNAPGYSNASCNHDGCSPLPLPPGDNGIDVVFIIDNTGSLGDASLTQLRNNITQVLDDIQTASGNNYRLALVTPDNDQVDVRLQFSSNNRAAFLDKLNSNLGIAGDGTTPVTGNNTPESTDECLDTVVHALLHATRTNPRDCTPPDSPLQYNDFNPGFASNALKLVVLITDTEPGGFCDEGDNGYQAGIYAQYAGNNCIHINAILVNDGSTDSTAIAVMQNYYKTSCGWYEEIPTDGTGIADAVKNMLYAPGYCNCQ